MPQDQKKRQQAIMKKRRKDKARRQKKAMNTPREHLIIQNARKYPIHECLINADWEDEEAAGLVRILVTRQQPDESIIMASYLVDIYCLGLKDTFARANLLVSEYKEFVAGVYFDVMPETCTPELAHEIIYGAIDYAAQFGFKPNRDFKDSQKVLEPRDTFEKTGEVTFGKDGKPFFVRGPHDNVNAILSKLNKNPGVGNYEYYDPSLGFGDFDDDFDNEEDELD